MASFLGCTKC